MAYDIGPKIGIDGEAEFRKQINNINQQLKTLGTEMKAVTSEFELNEDSQETLAKQTDVLTRQIAAQEEKLELLRKGLAKAEDAYDSNDDKVLKWQQSVNNATSDLNKLKTQLKKTGDEAQDMGDAMKDSSEGVEGAFQIKGIDDLIEGLGTLKGTLMGGAIVAGVTEITGAILDLEESTREYRSIMGQLETSGEAAGYSAEQTATAYNHLYGVLGDNQTTATTVANLQAIGLSQQDLIAMTDLATGAWVKYGDSIPIDGLAESINETIRAGSVTGTFADVINWGSDELQTFGVQLKEDTEANEEWNEAVKNATTSEDFFNLALSECSTQAERADLIMRTMAEQGLQELNDKYRETEEVTIQANESQAAMEEAMGKLGEAVAPVANALRNFGAQTITGLANIIDDAITNVRNLREEIKKLGRETENANWSQYSVQKGALDGFKSPYDGSHADGLEFVPWDNYRANLHYGERVLTAEQNDAFTSFVNSLKGSIYRAPDLQALSDSVVRGVQNSGGAAAVQPVTIVVQSVLDGKIVAENVTKHQLMNERSAGR